MKDLFSTLPLGRIQLRNRLAVAPMTTAQSHPDGTVSEAEDDLARAPRRRTATAWSSPARRPCRGSSIAFHNQLSLGDDAHLPGLTALAARLGASRA